MELCELPEETKKRLLHVFGIELKWSKTKPGDWILPSSINLTKIKEFQIYEDDIWIITTPKSGTTWMQELAWLIMHDIDIGKSECDQFFRCPFLESEYLIESYPTTVETAKKFASYPDVPCDVESTNWYMRHSMEYTKKMTRPRIIKTHLPLSLLPEKLLDTCKVIFVTRNLKDAAVSFYHHFKLRTGSMQSFGEFANCFINSETLYTPFIPTVLEVWEKRNHPNMFFTTYEEMKKNLKKVALKLISILRGSSYTISDKQMETLLEAVDIESFRKNVFINKTKDFIPDEDGNTFIRKGIIGDWKNYFNKEMNREWDAAIEQQLLTSDFTMVFQ